jgi:hypothetical protein
MLNDCLSVVSNRASDDAPVSSPFLMIKREEVTKNSCKMLTEWTDCFPTVLMGD